MFLEVDRPAMKHFNQRLMRWLYGRYLPWIGGKKIIREEITKRFRESFGRYIEVFGGAGWVLFHKQKQADLEVITMPMVIS